MLVTVKSWYMPRRVYGHVVGRNARYIFVQGSWGLGQFHPSVVREVRSNKARTRQGQVAPQFDNFE